MGGTKRYQESGGFDFKTYKQIGETSNGIKILEKIGDKNTNTPMYSNTPYTMYAVLDEHGIIKQISVYREENGRKKIKDIDFGHEHTNSDGTHFNKGEIHVQLYDGFVRLSDKARRPSKKEKRIMMMALYGRR